MLPVTGSDLPPEVIAKILSNFMTIVTIREKNYRRWKHELVAPSLVCKYWAECVRPALFRDIKLMHASDVSFLTAMVYSLRFNASSLNGAIKYIRAEHRFPPLPEPWLHHLYPLMTRLPDTVFTCSVWRESRTHGSPMPICWPPFAALPRVPPSFYTIRLQVIQITRSELKSTTDLARIVDSFPTLHECYFSQLKFVESSPVLLPRQTSRKVPRGLRKCKISECAEMSLSDQVALALDAVAAVPRLGLIEEDRQWKALVDALLASVPSSFKKATVELSQSGGEPLDNHAPSKIAFGFSSTECPDQDQLWANVWVEQTHTPAVDSGNTPAHISAISLNGSFAALRDRDALFISFDDFQEATSSTSFGELRFWVREGDKLDQHGLQSLLRSMLRCEQLTWALSRGVLGLQHCVLNRETNNWDETQYIHSSEILTIIADRSFPIIDSTPPTLDDDEYAEYLSLFFEEERHVFLQQLPTLRVERAKDKMPMSQDTSELPKTQVTAAPALHAREADCVGHKQDEEGRADREAEL